MDTTINQVEKKMKYKDLAGYLCLSENTLRKMVMERTIPFYKIGRSVRFDLSVIDEWLATKRFEAK